MKVRKIRITRQIMLVISLVVLIGDIFIGFMVYRVNSTIILEQIRQRVIGLAASASANVDGAVFEELLDSQGQDQEAYDEVYDELDKFVEADQLKYIYTYYQEDGNFYFAVDTDKEEPADFGEVYDYLVAIETAFSGTTLADEEATSDEWGTYISAYSPIYNGEEVVGVVGADLDYQDVLNELKMVMVKIVLICAAVFALVLLALFIIERRLTRGFVTLNDKISALSDGTGNLSKKIEINTGDELEVIAETINSFMSQLKIMTKQVADSSNSNAATVQELNEEMTSLSANMEECSATTENVCTSLNQAAEDTIHLYGQMTAVRDSVEEDSHVAQQAAETAVIKKNQAVDRLESLNGSIGEALESARNIDKVRGIVDEIDDISFQTKLLSMNAQIEAARAGEAGKGFAVVATEIANLSEKTNESVQGIVEINEDVQSAMNKLKNSINEMYEFVSGPVMKDYEDYSALGESYGKTTDEILTKMDELKAESQDISNIINQVNESVSNINKAVSDSTEQIMGAVANSEDINNNMNEILQISILKNA